MMEHVDGNALAGILTELLARDVTLLEIECSGCGDVAPLAAAIVERDDVAAIVRCRGCTHTLLTVLTAPDAARIVMGNVASLRF